MKNKIFLFIFIILFSCCNTKIKNNDIKQITIIPNNESDIKSSDISDSVLIIPLETNNDCLLGYIGKITYINDKIYVCSNNAIYLFDNKGKYLSKIDKKGLGPNEYIRIDDFQILTNGNVIIISRADKKIFEFDLQQNCVSSIDLNYWPMNFYLDKSNIFVYLGNTISDCENKKIVKYENRVYNDNYIDIDFNKSKYLHVISVNNFTKYQDSLYFYECYNDTIYQYSNNTFKGKYYVNYDNKNIPSDLFDYSYSNIMEFCETLHQYDYAYGNYLFTETDNNYYIAYVYDYPQLRFAICNKSNSLTNSCTKIIENACLCNYPLVFDLDNMAFINNNLLIFSIENNSLSEYMNLQTDFDIKEKLSKIISQDKEANPIIAILKLK